VPRTVEGEVFVTTSEAMEILHASRQRFYKNARPSLKAYRFSALKYPWYKEQDIFDMRDGKLVRKGEIKISGILGDWTDFLRSLGYTAETIDRSIEVVTLPEEAVRTFGLPKDGKFVKRSKMTLANGTPICTWDTYYPVELVDDFLDEMKSGTAGHVVERIKAKGVVIGKAKDKYSARITTMEEQNLFHLVSDEAVLLLQRVSYTADKRVLVLYSDMVLLGTWFSPEHEYEVHAFD
jgi:DNA-binding GntR family transcriptional regulator